MLNFNEDKQNHKIWCDGSEAKTLSVLRQLLGKENSDSQDRHEWFFSSDKSYEDAHKKIDDYEKEHNNDLEYAAESIIIKEEIRIPGTNILLEKGDKIIWKEADDSKPKFICVSGEKDLKDSVKLPDRVVLTNNGAYDLEQKKMSGWYVWVGYEHKSWKSEPTMQSILARTAEEVGRWMSKKYVGKYNVDNFWKTLDMFRVWVEDISGKIQKELDHKKNEAQILEDSGLIERKVVFDEPLFQYIVEYRSEPAYSGRVNYYHVRDVKFESKLERRMHEFGFNVYFNDSGRGKYPYIGFSDLRKTYDMEEWLKVLNTLYNIMNKIADYEKTYVKIYY